MRFLIATALAFALIFAVFADWENIDEAHRLGGRMASSGYLRGKVVLVAALDYGNKANVPVMKRLQALWVTYKSKPFVLIGVHVGEAGDERVGKIIKAMNITHPVYRDIRCEAIADGSFKDGTFFVIDSFGRLLSRSEDDRRAQGIIGSAIVFWDCPVLAKGFEKNIDFCLKNLPGRAYNLIKEMRKKFPDEASKYDDDYKRMSNDEDILKLAKLEALANQAKNRDFSDNKAKKLSAAKLEKVLDVFSYLKMSSDPLVAQEAKNSLAEIMWALASVKPKSEKLTGGKNE